jgi:hypothetical protein
MMAQPLVAHAGSSRSAIATALRPLPLVPVRL